MKYGWINRLILLAVQIAAGFGIYYGLDGIKNVGTWPYILMAFGSIVIFGITTVIWFWIGMVWTITGGLGR